MCYTWRMPRDEQITYADHLGRFYARRYAYPPMVGRVLGYLLVCEPRDQTIAELSEALLASRSAITGALSGIPSSARIRFAVGSYRSWPKLLASSLRSWVLMGLPPAPGQQRRRPRP